MTLLRGGKPCERQHGSNTSTRFLDVHITLPKDRLGISTNLSQYLTMSDDYKMATAPPCSMNQIKLFYALRFTSQNHSTQTKLESIILLHISYQHSVRSSYGHLTTTLTSRSLDTITSAPEFIPSYVNINDASSS